MAIELPPLPYARNALAPHISEETLDYHYGKHHQTYVDNLNKLIPGTPFEGKSLEEIVKTSSGPVFNNAAQIWNHTFYWHSLSPKSSKNPQNALSDAINHTFGSFEEFKQKFNTAATTVFGSGWAWLVKTPKGLEIVQTQNAGTPLTDPNQKPLLTCDVWEHAYYIDTRNSRPKYMENFWELANWEFAEKNFKG